MTQEQQILKHLLKKGSITSWEAIEKYRITRLSARIYTLRNADHNIESMRIQKKDVWFVKYILK